jgi:hypothetical protein
MSILLKSVLPNAKNRPTTGRLIALHCALLLAPSGVMVRAETPQDPLAAGFIDPPNSARPRTWWHWMNGNITEDGIRQDLEWMSRVGLGGVQNFDAALMTPQVVPQRLVYMTPAWKEAFRFAVVTADHLGLEFAIAGSPGWSESGGPWVTPKDAMKKFVWSETVLVGGHRFKGSLPEPPSVTGPYQAIPAPPSLASLMSGGKSEPRPTYYGDTAVIAYKMPDVSVVSPSAVFASDGQRIEPGHLADAAGPAVTLGLSGVDPSGPSGTLTIEYEKPQTIRSASVYLPGSKLLPFVGAAIAVALEVQEESGSWRKIADIPVEVVPITVSFPPITARNFRLMARGVVPSEPSGTSRYTLPGVAMPTFNMPAATAAKVSLFQLSAEPRVNRVETKAGFMIVDDYYALDDDAGPEVIGVAPQSVIDLTGKVTGGGHLDWTPPPGRWKVLRFGYSLEGTTNHPATKEATGLEVDEYDGAAVRSYLDTYLGMYAQVTGPELMGKRGLRAQVNDSTEVGPSNWTPAILEQFQRLRGYDPRPWLPALTGVIVESRAHSDAFLYDFRRTLADLVATEHYGTIASVVHEHGMIEYGEALESTRPSLGDDLDMRRYTDVPMSAMWVYNPTVGQNPVYITDVKGAASVAHIYGQNLVAAESMTSSRAPWAFAPSDLKRYIDLEFASGVNRPVIHTSVHQPLDDKVPGLSLMIFGQHFNRHETWAEMARPWVDYMARSAYLLQQGRNVADVAYFYGEEAPLVALYMTALPADAPTHYAYDYINTGILTREISIDGHDLVTPGGARYRALYLGGSSRRMTVPVLRRLAALADGGATIVGAAPELSPSLKDDPEEFASLVRRLWGDGAVTHVGRGVVYASRAVESVLAQSGLTADFKYAPSGPDIEILFQHRRITDGDIYFVDNRKTRDQHVEARFRVMGKAPEIWRADTGSRTPAAYRIEASETVVSLDLAAEEAVFVVFRSPAQAAARTVETTAWIPTATIAGPWELAFEANRGAPPNAHFDQLKSLTDNADSGIKYFSGTVTYTTRFVLPRTLKAGTPLMLDLGRVGDIAEVAVNGTPVGTAWKAPYQVDIAKAAKAGNNTLVVKVADLWVNRLIGDAQPGAKKVAYTTLQSYLPSAPLRPSGLLGPVTLRVPQIIASP